MYPGVPFVILVILLHLGFFLTSTRPDRRRRLFTALSLAGLSIPLLLLALVLPQQGSVGIIRGILFNSPLYLPVLAFLVYLRPGSSSTRRRR